MELPDEAIAYNYQGLMAQLGDEWTPAAELRAQHFVAPGRFRELQQRLMQCRGLVAADRELAHSSPDALPLEPGFINLPQELLDGYRRKQEASVLGQVLTLANRLREQADRIVFLGAGGPYLAARALFGALRSGYHNELPPETRLGVPRIYFEGHSADNDSFQELLDVLQITCVDPDRPEERWAVVSLGKTGANLEPAVALRVFRREAAEYYGLRSPWPRQLFAAATGTASPLRSLYEVMAVGDESILTIPENVGERFSVFTPAGLLPAALMGLDVRALLLGAAAMTKRFLEEPIERNPVLQYAGLNYLLVKELDKPIRVLSVWSRKLESVGAWYDHLLAESLGKQGGGPTPLTVVETRDQYTRGQHHQEGPRDRVINHLVVKSPSSMPLGIQMADHNEDDLNRFNRKTIPDITRAVQKVASQIHFEAARPTATIAMPVLSEHTLGQLLQMFMLATVVEGRLMGINPYSQPAVEVCRAQVIEALKSEE